MHGKIPFSKLAVNAVFISCLVGLVAIATHALMNTRSMVWLIRIGCFVAGMFLVVSFVNMLVLRLLYLSRQPLLFGFLRYGLSFLGAAAVTVLYYVVSGYLHREHEGTVHLARFRLFANDNLRMYAFFILVFSINAIVLLIHNLILIKDLKNKVELENAELKLKNLEATYDQLKQHIHPHFLFNSLSTLKSLIRRNPAVAEEYLVTLSGVLRAAMDDTKAGLVTIEEELHICRQYLDMQKMRFGDALNFCIDIPREKQLHGCVPFFSILPLLENAIKHNALTAQNPLEIAIVCNGDYIEVSNRKQVKESKESGMKSGLNNLKRRYEILSGEAISVQNDAAWFSVKLKILGRENRDH